MRRGKEKRMHCGNMMGPSEEAGATENGREYDVPNISNVCRIDTLFENTHSADKDN
jgi:hypothetical protein